MGETSILSEILQNIGLPLVTGIMGWFGNMWRSRQRKDKDILDNVIQILDIQKKYIEEQQGTIDETKKMNKRLEGKLNKEYKCMRQAFKCKYSNVGDGCPVLLLEERYDNDTVCEDCKLKKEVQNAEGATENR